jgi:putative methyltransferase (TIGR04325 family)
MSLLTTPTLDEALRQIAAIPTVRELRQRRYERSFARMDGWRNLHRGLYRSFDEARASAPDLRQVGYELDDDWYAAQATAIAAHDYPVLFWLERLMPELRTIFDLGGHVGVHYHAYAQRLRYPADLTWTVCELPHVVARGEALKQQRPAPQLRFVSDFGAGDGASLLLSAGCLQFMERPLGTMLAGLRQIPTHVILNKVPVYDLPTRVTLQNTGRSFTPCWLFNRDQFLRPLQTLGYEVIDSWSVPDRSLRIPFHPEHRIDAFSGFYLRRTATPI